MPQEDSKGSRPSMGTLVCGKYRLIENIGSGTFGSIVLGWDHRKKKAVAVKIARDRTGISSLKKEASVYNALMKANKNKIPAVPEYYDFFCDTDYALLVTELLFFSLNTLFKACKKKFSLKTTLQLADQMLQRLQFLHSKGFVHCDIKPDNFMLGYGQKLDFVYIIDFGTAKRYVVNGNHILRAEDCSFVGTKRYSSVSSHLKIEQSRRDDLEALGYILVYFLKGKLPWQGLSVNDSAGSKSILKVKATTPIKDLCAELPHEFAAYVSYTRALRFDEPPDYAYLRHLFRSLYRRCGYDYDGNYDWSSMSFEEIRKGSCSAVE